MDPVRDWPDPDPTLHKKKNKNRIQISTNIMATHVVRDFGSGIGDPDDQTWIRAKKKSDPDPQP